MNEDEYNATVVALSADVLDVRTLERPRTRAAASSGILTQSVRVDVIMDDPFQRGSIVLELGWQDLRIMSRIRVDVTS